jgi:hypothetical protein
LHYPAIDAAPVHLTAPFLARLRLEREGRLSRK